MAREGGCPRGKEERKRPQCPVLIANQREGFGAFISRSSPDLLTGSPFQNSCQHFIDAPHAHLELQKLSSLLLFPVFNAVVRPSNPRHREAAPSSARRTVPRPVKSLPQEHHSTPSHSHPGSDAAPSSARRCNFFPSAGGLGSSGLQEQAGEGSVTLAGGLSLYY